MSVRMMIFYLAFFCLQAYAEEVPQFRYSVTDKIRAENSRIEVWKLHSVEKKEEKWDEMTRETFAKNPLLETEVLKKWITEVRYPGRDFYLREFLETHPVNKKHGERGHGYTELRSISTHAVLESSPLFYEVEKITGGMRVTFQFFFNNEWHLEIIKDYEESDTYEFPFRESRISTWKGRVQEHVVYERQPEEE